jgi:hypothetical protein
LRLSGAFRHALTVSADLVAPAYYVVARALWRAFHTKTVLTSIPGLADDAITRILDAVSGNTDLAVGATGSVARCVDASAIDALLLGKALDVGTGIETGCHDALIARRAVRGGLTALIDNALTMDADRRARTRCVVVDDGVAIIVETVADLRAGDAGACDARNDGQHENKGRR